MGLFLLASWSDRESLPPLSLCLIPSVCLVYLNSKLLRQGFFSFNMCLCTSWTGSSCWLRTTMSLSWKLLYVFLKSGKFQLCSIQALEGYNAILIWSFFPLQPSLYVTILLPLSCAVPSRLWALQSRNQGWYICTRRVIIPLKLLQC